jgi:hypothetical protein
VSEEGQAQQHVGHQAEHRLTGQHAGHEVARQQGGQRPGA